MYIDYGLTYLIGFKSRGAVTFHMRIHLNERPFKCDHVGCEKSFKQKSNLLQHISSVHAQVRPFECSRCGKQFKTKFSAQEHERKSRCKVIDNNINNHSIDNIPINTNHQSIINTIDHTALQSNDNYTYNYTSTNHTTNANDTVSGTLLLMSSAI